MKKLIDILKRKGSWHRTSVNAIASGIRDAMTELPQTATSKDIKCWVIEQEKEGSNGPK